jgi:hypothetical protein
MLGTLKICDKYLQISYLLRTGPQNIKHYFKANKWGLMVDESKGNQLIYDTA